jgi:hypothetical protein
MNNTSMPNQYKLWLFIIGLTVFSGFFLGYYCAKQQFGHQEKRIQTLEQQYVSSLKPGQEIKMDEVKILIAKSVDEAKDQNDLLAKFGLPLTIAALLASIFGAYTWAAEIAKQKAESAFKDSEQLLREGKRILVVTPDGQDQGYLQKFFQMMGFPNVLHIKLSELETQKNERFDLCIINVPSDESGPSKYNSELDNFTMGKIIFYFGKGIAINTTLSNDGRLAFASAKSQLYANIINALKYADKML